MRGEVFIRLERITPACAGITEVIHNYAIICEDHPRVCGNYFYTGTVDNLWIGSPPRVRELHITGNSRKLSTRITPACAGITLADSV